jgi:hypothetical protein
MAFTSSAGWNNLPNGNFVPVIYSKKVLKFFRRASVAEAITNTDYYGEISDYGDTVNIINEPTILVSDYTRGNQNTTQDLDDDQIQLTVDQAKYFQFAVDDLEAKQAHHNWEEMATSSGAYALKNGYDQNVLSYMAGQVSSSSPDNVIGSDSATKITDMDTAAGSLDLGYGAGELSPLAVMARMSRLLDDQDVPEENRWFVAKPEFWEVMADENSKLMGVDFTGDSSSKLRNGKVTDGQIRGFTCYKSNNVPATTNATGQVMAGHMSSTATASQIAKTEALRSHNFFGDVVRGLHLFGRKTLRTDAMTKAFYTID